MCFEEDLELGKKYELEFIKFKGFKEFKVMQGEFLDYDIIADNIKYEIKTDLKSQYTSNICIEFECNDKMSGINTSKSDYYGYFVLYENDEYDLYEIPTKKIKKYIRKNKYKKIKFGGDNGRSKFYLFDRSIFKKYKIF